MGFTEGEPYVYALLRELKSMLFLSPDPRPEPTTKLSLASKPHRGVYHPPPPIPSVENDGAVEYVPLG